MRIVVVAAGLLFALSPARADKPARPQVTVSLRAVAKTSDSEKRHVLRPSESLRAGDRLAFELQVTAPTYLYLYQASGKDTPNVLFPNPALKTKNPVRAGVTVRIPGGDRWFVLDDKDLGKETVFIVASSRPLSRLEDVDGKARDAQLAAIRDEKSPPGCKQRGLVLEKEQDGDCPTERGLHLEAEAADGEPEAEPDTLRFAAVPGDDTLFAQFSFLHVAR